MGYRFLSQSPKAKQFWVLQVVAFLVAATGLITIASTLEGLVHLKHSRLVDADAHITLLAGLSLIYLATLLRRGKQTAWAVSVVVYLFLLIRNIRHFGIDLSGIEDYDLTYFLNLFMPTMILIILFIGRSNFKVRSEIRNLRTAVRRAVLVLAVAFAYGTFGFQLMDKHDFHQDITLATGAHYTVDQFGLTTDKQLTPHTKRGHLFLGSLAAISLGSIFYVGLALFSPIRFKLSSHENDYLEVRAMLQKYPSNSEDFFKLWPRDKAYFIDPSHRSAIVYKSVGGSALAVGDPLGSPSHFKNLVASFLEYCRLNDWTPAFVHTLEDHLKIYQSLGLEAQKLGEEAIVNVKKFNTQVVNNKYFRNIVSRFAKQGYTTELLQPPHNDSVMARLREISDDWLKAPNRSERGFMMGYFNSEYLQQCPIMVVRDAAGTMQAFVNQLPKIDPKEANYDFLRHSRRSPGNINDFLMVNFIAHLQRAGYSRLNMGLCPFSGFESDSIDNPGLVDNLLKLIYANSSRFYSFKGLRKFKEKYEPEWRPRYLVYDGGLIGLTKTANNLLRAMRVKT